MCRTRQPRPPRARRAEAAHPRRRGSSLSRWPVPRRQRRGSPRPTV